MRNAVNAAYRSCRLENKIAFTSLLLRLSHITERQSESTHALQWKAEIVLFSESDETSCNNLLTFICAFSGLDHSTEELLVFTIRPVFSNLYLRRLSMYISWLAAAVPRNKIGSMKHQDDITETAVVRSDINGESEDAITHLCNALPHSISYIFLVLFNV